MRDVCEQIGAIGILPVVKIDNAGDSENLAASLLAGDLPAVEITFRTDAAQESIKRIKKKFPEMLVGAGTVLSIDQVKQAVGAGAEFIVAPGFNPKTAEYCVSHNIPFFPGISGPGQIEAALEYGLSVLKFFPAEVMGGIKMIKSLSAPYNKVKFIPTGGINIQNISRYLAQPSVLACGGSWVAPAGMIQEGRFDDIAKLAHEAVTEIVGFRLSGVSLKPLPGSEIESTLDFFASNFLLGKDENDDAYTAGGVINIEKGQIDHEGQLIFSVPSLARALAFLSRKSIPVLDTGKTGECVLKKQKGGFEIKVVERELK